MQSTLFFRFGKWVYRHRMVLLLLWCALIVACLPFLSHLMAPFESTGFVAKGSESDKTNTYLNRHLGYQANRFIVIYHSKTLLATEPAFIKQIQQSLLGLKHFSMAHEIILPDANQKQIAKDQHTASVMILFKTNKLMSQEKLFEFKKAIKKPPSLTMYLGGEALFIESINQQTQEDLLHADFIAAPASIITLIIVFGSLVAAILPIVLGGGCAVIILTSLYFLGYVFSLSVFTLNVAMLLGLCLSLDYALFMIYRFREELHTGHTIETVIAQTIATAGRAVFFSGLAVFISLSALLFFSINILISVGVGGLVAVFTAVAIAITLLPAILSLLKEAINYLTLISEEHKQDWFLSWQYWRILAIKVVEHPLICLSIALGILLFLAYPFRMVHVGLSNANILPDHTQSKQFFDYFKKKFNINELTPIVIMIKAKHGSILSAQHLTQLKALANKIQQHAFVEQVDSIVSTSPELTVQAYHALYTMPARLQPAIIQQLLKTTTTSQVTVMNVVSRYDENSKQTQRLIKKIRAMKPGKGLSMSLTGVPVTNVDVMHAIAKTFPIAASWIMVLTYLILLCLLRSIFLPFKALLMNILSLAASYGVLVFVFQEGHFHHLLNFHPQGMLDMSLLIIIFCALFGFSMDYEVFLLSRIKECYDVTHDHKNSIVFGIEKSCRVITSAAMIVIILCGSFMFANDLMVREFGLGIAIAIFVDAFIIRTFLVPAIMTLLDKWTWYAPRWLK